MEEGLDTGDMLSRVEFDIPTDMRLNALMQQLTNDACKLTLTTIRNFEHIAPQKQDDSQATLCKKIKKSDGEIDFEDAMVVYNKYRAFEGWPGVFASNGTKLDGLGVIDSQSQNSAYKILAFKNNSIMVGCNIGILKIDTLQPVSKKAMSAKSYCAGRGLRVGDNLI